MLDGHLLVLKRWEKGLEQRKDLMQSIPIWIRFPTLHLHLWSPRLLSRVASCIGRPLFMDCQMQYQEKIEFTHVCVEVEAGEELPDEVHVEIGGNMETVKVIYDWRPTVCVTCRIFGHKAENCSTTKKWQEKGKEKVDLQEEVKAKEDDASHSEEDIHTEIVIEGNQGQEETHTTWSAENPDGLNRQIVLATNDKSMPQSSQKGQLVVPITQLQNQFSMLWQRDDNMEIDKSSNAVDESDGNDTATDIKVIDTIVQSQLKTTPKHANQQNQEDNAECNRVVSTVDKLRSKTKAGKRLAVTHASLKEKLRAATWPTIVAVVSKEWKAKMASIQEEVAAAGKNQKQKKIVAAPLGIPLFSRGHLEGTYQVLGQQYQQRL